MNSQRTEWCNKCLDWVTPRVYHWESSIAIIEDEYCPRHNETVTDCFFLGKRSVQYKRNHPEYGSPPDDTIQEG